MLEKYLARLAAMKNKAGPALEDLIHGKRTLMPAGNGRLDLGYMGGLLGKDGLAEKAGGIASSGLARAGQGSDALEAWLEKHPQIAGAMKGVGAGAGGGAAVAALTGHDGSDEEEELPRRHHYERD